MVMATISSNLLRHKWIHTATLYLHIKQNSKEFSLADSSNLVIVNVDIDIKLYYIVFTRPYV